MKKLCPNCNAVMNIEYRWHYGAKKQYRCPNCKCIEWIDCHWSNKNYPITEV